MSFLQKAGIPCIDQDFNRESVIIIYFLKIFFLIFYAIKIIKNML